MDSLVKAIALNTPSAKKRNFYILSYSPGEDLLFRGEHLSNYFNLIYLYYDLYNCYKIENGSQSIVCELTKIIERDDDAIVFGHSFNGYVAHQLACILPQISYCVMIDTYNFFELDKYNGKHFFSNLLGNMYKQVVLNKDYVYPFWLFRSFYKKKSFVKTEDYAEFKKGCDVFLENFHNRQAINNCIFFKASRSFFRYKEHGYSWKPYVKGQFYLKNLITDHKHIMQRLDTEIAACIYETVSHSKAA